MNPCVLGNMNRGYLHRSLRETTGRHLSPAVSSLQGLGQGHLARRQPCSTVVRADKAGGKESGPGFGKKTPSSKAPTPKKLDKTVKKAQPVVQLTIISGFSTSGKKALVEELMMDFDTSSKSKKPLQLTAVDEMQEDDLVAALWAKAEAGFTHVLVETSDIAEPEEFLTFLAENCLGGPARLEVDSMVTCVDVASLLGLLTDPPTVASLYPAQASVVETEDDQWLEAVPDDPSDFCSLPILKQLEYADVIVVSGMEATERAEDLEIALALLRTLNAHAAVRVRGAGRPPVRVGDLVGKDLYDPEETPRNAGWVQALANPSDDGLPALHAPQGHAHTHFFSDRYRLTTATFKSQRPFHPQRLNDLVIAKSWPGLIRGKGFCLLATRPDDIGMWDSSGHDWQHEYVMTVDRAASSDDSGSDEHVEGIVKVHGASFNLETLEPVRYGKWQSIVFVGVNLDYGALKAALDACLLTDEEMALGPDAWMAFPDPLPAYNESDQVHDHDHDIDIDDDD